MLDEIVKPKCSKFALFSNTAGITLGKINKVIPYNKRQKNPFIDLLLDLEEFR